MNKKQLVSDFVKKARWHAKQARKLREVLPSVRTEWHDGHVDAFLQCARLLKLYG